MNWLSLIQDRIFTLFTLHFAWTGDTETVKPMIPEDVPMKDRNVLIDAILSAYDNEAYQPVYHDGKLVSTFCNLAANEIAQKVDCQDLYDETLHRVRTADEIYAYVSSHPTQWQEIKCATLQPDFQQLALESVQTWANSGYLTRMPIISVKSMDMSS